jgi:hypothetical protein
MKVLFVGPTLHGEPRGRSSAATDIERRAPAAQGDIAKAVLDGATAIGLVDGRYEDVAAPWHKEILFALSEGAAVLGGGSLGALRAAECAAFGMIGVGNVFDRYARGELVDDSDVAQLHAPGELDFAPLTEALVNVEATLRRLRDAGLLEERVASELRRTARAMFFKELTYETIVARSPDLRVAPHDLLELILPRRVDLKREDAIALVARLQSLPDRRSECKPAWVLAQPLNWRRELARLTNARSAKSGSVAPCS